jgi:hypothetical protein
VLTKLGGNSLMTMATTPWMLPQIESVDYPRNINKQIKFIQMIIYWWIVE